MKNYFFLFTFILLLSIINNVFSQDDELVKVTRVVPLYCLEDVLERPSNVKTVIVDGNRAINKGCVDRIRLTFQNSEVQKIRNIKFDLTLYEKGGEENFTLYKGRHLIELILLPEEVMTYDLILNNKISPPEGKKDFDDKTSWGWKVEIIKINSN